MRTANIFFRDEQLAVSKGINIVEKSNMRVLSLYAVLGRTLELPVYEGSIPTALYPRRGPSAGILQLAALSLLPDANGVLCAACEFDTNRHMLVFIDTFDDMMPVVCSGEYSLPRDHDMRLPKAFVPTKFGPAHYGLIVCAPLEDILIRSTNGHLVKIHCDERGELDKIPCSPRDRALMRGPF